MTVFHCWNHGYQSPCLVRLWPACRASNLASVNALCMHKVWFKVSPCLSLGWSSTPVSPSFWALVSVLYGTGRRFHLTVGRGSWWHCTLFMSVCVHSDQCALVSMHSTWPLLYPPVGTAQLRQCGGWDACMLQAPWDAAILAPMLATKY